MLRAVPLLLVLAILIAHIPAEVDGCAPVPRRGESIRIAEESAIIVWDPVKKVEHFIRSAAFDTKSPDFGFLVPTPNVPTLKEVESGIFAALEQWIQPRVVEQTRLQFDPMLCLCCVRLIGMSARMAPGAAGVRVVSEQKVGGYDAAILEADNTQDLADWLKKHNYSNDPELQSWLFPYVAHKWKITAFKINQDPKTGKLATTKPVRMSFATDRPFFPYREPERKPDDVKPKEPPVTEVDGLWRITKIDGPENEPERVRELRVWFGQGVSSSHPHTDDIGFAVDVEKEPKWLDLGARPGIYKLEGDTLHWCLGKDKRPTKFDPTEGAYMALQRQPKQDADAVAADVAHRKAETLRRGRLLRVFFIAGTRMDGKLGNADWPAQVSWSDELSDEQRSKLAGDTGVEIPTKAWLTTFEDRANPRPSKEEVYFDPARERTPIRPEVIHYTTVWIPIDLIVLGLVIMVVVASIIVRLRRRAAAPVV